MYIEADESIFTVQTHNTQGPYNSLGAIVAIRIHLGS